MVPTLCKRQSRVLLDPDTMRRSCVSTERSPCGTLVLEIGSDSLHAQNHWKTQNVIWACIESLRRLSETFRRSQNFHCNEVRAIANRINPNSTQYLSVPLRTILFYQRLPFFFSYHGTMRGRNELSAVQAVSHFLRPQFVCVCMCVCVCVCVCVCARACVRA